MLDPEVASHHPFPNYGAAEGLDMTDSIGKSTAIIPSSFPCCLVHWQPEKPSWKRGIKLDFEDSRILISGEQIMSKSEETRICKVCSGMVSKPFLTRAKCYTVFISQSYPGD